MGGAEIIGAGVSGGRARVAGLPPANFRGPSGTEIISRHWQVHGEGESAADSGADDSFSSSVNT